MVFYEGFCCLLILIFSHVELGYLHTWRALFFCSCSLLLRRPVCSRHPETGFVQVPREHPPSGAVGYENYNRSPFDIDIPLHSAEGEDDNEADQKCSGNAYKGIKEARKRQGISLWLARRSAARGKSSLDGLAGAFSLGRRQRTLLVIPVCDCNVIKPGSVAKHVEASQSPAERMSHFWDWTTMEIFKPRRRE